MHSAIVLIRFLKYLISFFYRFLNPQKYVRAMTESTVDISSIKITNADRAGKRGKFGGDFVEDEEWAEQIKVSVS